MTIDHLIPISKGGTNDEWNLATMCPQCNIQKADLLIPKFVELSEKLQQNSQKHHKNSIFAAQKQIKMPQTDTLNKPTTFSVPMFIEDGIIKIECSSVNYIFTKSTIKISVFPDDNHPGKAFITVAEE